MIESGRGDPKASPLCLPMHVSNRVDSEVPIQGARQRGGRVPEDQDGRGEKEVHGNRAPERNIQPDQIHIVVSFPPKYSIAKVVQIIKQNTGRALWEKFDFIRERYWRRGGMWSVGYFVSTVGLDEQTILRYVRYQEKDTGPNEEKSKKRNT